MSTLMIRNISALVTCNDRDELLQELVKHYLFS